LETGSVPKTTVRADEVLESVKEPVAEPLEVLEKAGPSAKGTELTPTQLAGLRLALGVGLAIALVTALVFLDCFMGRPILPSVSVGTTPDQAEKMVQSFKELNAVNLDRATKLFDLIVVRAFLPVFTAILGYVFGSRADKGT
jgi:hypothetical protein